MGTLRKLRETIKFESLPAILFLPDDKFNPDVADTITVIDQKIYESILKGVTQALETNRKGVTRGSPK